MMLPTKPYRPRRTDPLGVHRVAGWSVKLTGITADGAEMSLEQRRAALGAAERTLPANDPGAAFLVAHRGEEALWVIVGWWRADISYQRMFHAPLGTVRLAQVGPDGPSGCVWELLAIDHERRAWVRHVLSRPHDPDLDSYLADTLVVAT